MGSKHSREDKAMSPLSSWGGSFDDLICGEGKICADQWTPIPSREGSPNARAFERSRTAASFRRMTAGYDDYDDDLEVIRQQPLPTDSYSMRNPIDIMDLDRPLVAPYQDYFPQRSTTPALQPDRHRKRKKKKKMKNEANMYPVTPIQIFIENRKALEIDTRNPSKTFIRLGPTANERIVHRVTKVKPYRHRSVSETVVHKRTSPAPYRGRSRMKRTISTFANSTTNSENISSLRSTRRVVPPRHLRPFEIPPPQPFMVRHLPDQPYHRIGTATHSHLKAGK